MSTMVMKFGGTSVADDSKLKVVAKKIIDCKQQCNNILVVVSAQGKTTNTLIEESKSLSATPSEREMDMLLSVGEQITASKLSILLNEMGYQAISLTGWQAGIKTNSVYENAKIEEICLERISHEFEMDNIVIVTGFQGINKNGDITTLGRGGSDTTAVALAAALGTKECYIYSDVDGIYSADPRVVGDVVKIDKISFNEMQEISDAGAKVLHNRSIEIGKKFDCSIVAKSTFTNGEGSRVCKKIETCEIKSIVNNEKLNRIELSITSKIQPNEIYKAFLLNNIFVTNYQVDSLNQDASKIQFYAFKTDCAKIQKILSEYNCNVNISEVCILSVIGYGVIQDNSIIIEVLKELEGKAEVLSINVSQYKIEVIANKISEKIVNNLHKKLILKSK